MSNSDKTWKHPEIWYFFLVWHTISVILFVFCSYFTKTIYFFFFHLWIFNISASIRPFTLEGVNQRMVNSIQNCVRLSKTYVHVVELIIEFKIKTTADYPQIASKASTMNAMVNLEYDDFMVNFLFIQIKIFQHYWKIDFHNTKAVGIRRLKDTSCSFRITAKKDNSKPYLLMHCLPLKEMVHRDWYCFLDWNQEEHSKMKHLAWLVVVGDYSSKHYSHNMQSYFQEHC